MTVASASSLAARAPSRPASSMLSRRASRVFCACRQRQRTRTAKHRHCTACSSSKAVVSALTALQQCAAHTRHTPPHKGPARLVSPAARPRSDHTCTQLLHHCYSLRGTPGGSLQANLQASPAQRHLRYTEARTLATHPFPRGTHHSQPQQPVIAACWPAPPRRRLRCCAPAG